MFTYYENNLVTPASIEARQKDFEAAKKQAKYGRWMALNHYLRLQNYQANNEHFRYLSGMNGSKYCPCGLVISEEVSENSKQRRAISDPMVLKKLALVGLDDLQLTFGHRDCADPTTFVVAFVIEAYTNPSNGLFVSKVICQVCGEYDLAAERHAKETFLIEHNTVCGGRNEHLSHPATIFCTCYIASQGANFDA